MKLFGNAALLAVATVLALAAFTPVGLAAAGDGAEHGDGILSQEEASESSIGGGIRFAAIALSAGLAAFAGALGTARAQAAIGAGGTAAMAEKPELFGKVFILVALPETIIVLCFVVAVLLIGKL